MQFQFFTVPLMQPEAAARDLNRFCATHRILSLDKALVERGDNSYWSFCIAYQANGENTTQESKRGKVDYKAILSDQDFQRFAQLRELRKAQAEAEGVPAYALFTNEQLATMVQRRVTTLTGLADIDGVGSAKVEKYGNRFVELLTQLFNGNSFSQATTTGADHATTKSDPQ